MGQDRAEHVGKMQWEWERHAPWRMQFTGLKFSPLASVQNIHVIPS